MKMRTGYILLFALLPYYAAGLAVMSIDFGGEYMKIAIVKPGVPMEIVLNKESLRKTPAIVSMKDGERTFGDPALNAGIRSPKTAYRYLLDILGKDFDNPLVAHYQKKLPYYDLEKDPETGSVLFKHEDDTRYSPEELIGMILQKAKEYAENFAEQPISEAVITVPAFFNQAERRAMMRAGELAGLKVLQLINDNTAVALNYGVFRRKIFNTTAVNYMFFDIGSSSTTATVVEYQIVKSKSAISGVVDTFPQLTIRGVGYDRTLGGVEFQMRLRDLLAKLFNQQKKTKKDVTADLRAMQKLYKEAGRLKQVLSANADHFAQVENILDDEDFRAKVTREDFENLCVDLFARVEKTVKDALAASELTMNDISEVILMGGGTRIPKIQETLKKTIGREDLGKGINTDEAAALGAVYQAANLGKGFKVKKFGIREAVLYPIQVEFERARSEGDNTDAPKLIKRVLFGRMQTYPQKKVLTFNKHAKDFGFEVNYGDLTFLNENELKELGSSNLSSVSMTGVEDTFAKHTTDDSESRGIKAHFRLDDSGILHLDKVEALFEKSAPVEPEEESTLSKIGKSFSNLFGGQTKEDLKDGSIKDEEPGEDVKNKTEELKDEDDTTAGAGKTEELKDEDDTTAGAGKTEELKDEDDTTAGAGKTVDSEEPPQETEQSEPVDKQESSDSETSDKQETPQETEEPVTSETKPESKDEKEKGETEKTEKTDEDSKKTEDETKKDDKNATKGEKEEKKKDEEKKEDKKPKKITVKEDIKMAVVVKDLSDPNEEKLKQAKKHIEDLKKKDEEKDLLERVKNEIETFIFEARDKLEQRDYRKCSTGEERFKISETLTSVSDWMYEQEDTTSRKEYDAKLKELKTATRDLYFRVYEMKERPAIIAELYSRVNHSEYFLSGMKNYTGEDKPFTQVEYDTLAKLITDTKEWNKTMTDEQKKTPLTEKPKFTLEDVAMKIKAIERELNYLIGKVKSFRPKTKPKETVNKTEGANDTKSTKAETKAKDEKEKRFKVLEDDDLDDDILLNESETEQGQETSQSESTTTEKTNDNGKLPDEL